MRRAMSTVAVIVSLVFASASACAGNGAFAHDEATGKYGFSWNESSQSAAESAALKGCNAPGCKVVFRTGSRECGAIAMTENGKVWGGAKRDRRPAAELASIENCQKRTAGQCKVRGAECNR